MHEPSIAAGFVSALVEYACARGGADRAALLEKAGLDERMLADGDARIPLARYVALMKAAIEASNDPAFALRYGADSDFRKYSVVGLIAYASTTMAEALEEMNRYTRLVVEFDGGGGPRFRTIARDGGFWLEDLRLNPNDFPEMTETTFSRFICGSRRDFPQAVFALEAHVTHAPPLHAGDYEKIWGVPVRFGASSNAIRMNPVWPTIRIQNESRYAFGVLTAHADRLLEALDQVSTMRGRVERLLLASLHKGDATIDDVAARLGLSRQTLYRRLREEGATFETVLDDLRHRLALDYLGGRKVSVNEAAYLVGFSEPAAFSRAFKRWTGKTPSEFRQSAMG